MQHNKCSGPAEKFSPCTFLTLMIYSGYTHNTYTQSNIELHYLKFVIKIRI